MNLLRISYFLAVVDQGTVTAAAQALHIAQPALSRQIKTLERELKLTLFESTGNRLKLTEQGEGFVSIARHFMHQKQAAEKAIASLRAGKIPCIHVAATQVTIRGLLSPFIAKTHPDDPVIIPKATNHFAIEDALHAGSDLGILPTVPSPHVASYPLGDAPIYAVVPEDHPWAEYDAVSIKQLAKSTLIVSSRRAVSRIIMDNALSEALIQPARLIECDEDSAIIALASAGHGIGITSLGTIPAGAVALPIHHAGTLKITLHAVWSPHHFAQQALRDLSKDLADYNNAA
ncbi:LysR family transcriptional regulator [Corynebacterium poyangense]|uniref:LysR family transcriptional regulator n=1 Tax=Corynebacterium poyangense TaxID=2684405 RepID=A0A7H0SQ53_9CORY|nr:LysR family transcriptional regulator [Corynebacterium poyangense]MBZ8178385.1 LysR family transcriptional regulator [Corynebacterium poyangense]QNQ90678.1 LysR family transcriptional regulator [Corynebacterium poyangense]